MSLQYVGDSLNNCLSIDAMHKIIGMIDIICRHIAELFQLQKPETQRPHVCHGDISALGRNFIQYRDLVILVDQHIRRLRIGKHGRHQNNFRIGTARPYSVDDCQRILLIRRRRKTARNPVVHSESDNQ